MREKLTYEQYADIVRFQDKVHYCITGASITTNALIMFIYLLMRSSKRKKLINILFFHKAICDCCVAFSAVPLPFFSKNTACLSIFGIYIFTDYISIAALGLCSLERYIAIKGSFLHWAEITPRQGIKAIMFMWFVTFILSIPISLLPVTNPVWIIEYCLVLLFITNIFVILSMAYNELKNNSVENRIADIQICKISTDNTIIAMQSETVKDGYVQVPRTEDIRIPRTEDIRILIILFSMAVVCIVTFLPLLFCMIKYTVFDKWVYVMTWVIVEFVHMSRTFINPVFTLLLNEDFKSSLMKCWCNMVYG